MTGLTSTLKRAKATDSSTGKGKKSNRSATVPPILRQIDQLSEPDRLRLEKTLARRAEAEWQREARRARRLARVRGIDQGAIDRAVEDVRYRQRVDGYRG